MSLWNSMGLRDIDNLYSRKSIAKSVFCININAYFKYDDVFKEFCTFCIEVY